jgi:carbon-monoxide dehydrogenase small subunit
VATEVLVDVEVNGVAHRVRVPPRLLLSDLLRDRLGLTGTHLACEQGVCGACTVLLDGRPVRSCLLFGVQVDGQQVTTVEGLGDEQSLHPVQQAFHDEHGMQCGFCTSGFLISTAAFLEEHPEPSDQEILDMLGGHLCRCTGYQNIIVAVRAAATAASRQEVPS